MREERGQVGGDVVVYELYTLWGSVGGNVKVLAGGKLYLRGEVYGDLIVEDGGRVHVFGNVKGKLVMHPGTKVIHSGTIGGNIVNLGGRLYIDIYAKTNGRIKTRKGGQTTHAPRPKEKKKEKT